VLLDGMNAELGPIRERAAAIREQPELVQLALARGTGRARELAQQTMAEVKERMGLA
jgi:tryptophanyl-tRNA synthetase